MLFRIAPLILLQFLLCVVHFEEHPCHLLDILCVAVDTNVGTHDVFMRFVMMFTAMRNCKLKGRYLVRKSVLFDLG